MTVHGNILLQQRLQDGQPRSFKTQSTRRCATICMKPITVHCMATIGSATAISPPFPSYLYQEKEHPRENYPVLRSCVAGPSTASTSGVVTPVCIFCHSVRKRHRNKFEYLGHCETPSASEAIKNAAKVLDDHVFLAQYGDIDFIAKEVKYHHSCRKLYLASADRKKRVRMQYYNRVCKCARKYIT